MTIEHVQPGSTVLMCEGPNDTRVECVVNTRCAMGGGQFINCETGLALTDAQTADAITTAESQGKPLRLAWKCFECNRVESLL